MAPNGLDRLDGREWARYQQWTALPFQRSLLGIFGKLGMWHHLRQRPAAAVDLRD